MQQHGQVPNMNHRPGPGMPMPQRSHSNPNPTQDNHYMSTNPPQIQRSVTSPYGGPLPSPNQVMGMGGMSGYQGLSDMMGGGLPPAHGGMPHSQQQGMNMSNPGGSGGNGYPGLPPHPSGRSDSGLGYENAHFPSAQGQGQLMQQHQRFGVGGPLSQGLGGQGREEPEFTIQVEDFPALPGSAVKSMQLDRGEGESLHLSPSSLRGHSQPLHLEGSPSLLPTSPSQTPAEQEAAAAATAKYMSSRTESEIKYGLLGLLDVVKMTNRDLNTLALGCDLTTFGLNLNSTESLYSNFTSPFSSKAVSSEPNFTTPACYRMHPPPSLKADHSTKFQLETLFYMFYAMPKDLLQATAAQELYKREWRYHGEQRLWLKARTQQELMQSHGNVQYMYFDVNVWEARLFSNTPAKGHLSSGFLTEEEIALKPSNMGHPPSQQQEQLHGMGVSGSSSVAVSNA